jgi:hypothetical protein
MAITRISDNQIASSTEAVLTTLSFLNTDSVFRLPSGDTSQQPTGVSVGTMRFNTEEDAAEIYVADFDGDGNPGWSAVGGGGGGGLGEYSFIRGNPSIFDETIIIPTPSEDPTYVNSFSKGPIITISSGTVITVSEGVTWSII